MDGPGESLGSLLKGAKSTFIGFLGFLIKTYAIAWQAILSAVFRIV